MPVFEEFLDCTTHIEDMNGEQRMSETAAADPEVMYVVYDSDVQEAQPGRELAFIEQREGSRTEPAQREPNEKYFQSLTEAKAFVRHNFRSGAEYFSSKQLNDPDNLLYVLADKLAYLMA